ncbi:MAG: methyltransferase [Rhodospirillaceae bacterium]|nr:methyltransferase [Rhodospirillaceae bacterium]|tara:strand:- start:4290 stop:5006 length:717 start_codon:yes stop_codon:yes gene_type:complete
MKSTGDGIKSENANWQFKGEVVKNFDEHVSRSVPFYSETQDLVCRISDFFVKKDSVIYDLGSSTGTLLANMSQRHAAKNARFIGIDHEEEMVSKASNKVKSKKINNIEFICDDIVTHEYESTSLVISSYTIQFVHTNHRQELINKIYKSLEWGGGFLMIEKVRAPDARFQDMMIQIYNDFKESQGFTPSEIFAKSQSLKGVMEPFSTSGNLGLLSRAGFVDVMPVSKYVCFEVLLAIK